MNKRLVASFISVSALTAVTCSAASVHAQTSAPGPYYAVPSWDQKLPPTTRFILLSNWNNEAVLDRETGLVWERTPAGSISDWFVANALCLFKTTGGRMGWQLPTIQQLSSLIDPSVPAPGPRLPAGHPFLDADGPAYWSSTSQAPSGAAAWIMDFSSGFPSGINKGTNFRSAWCVRGGQSADPQ